MSVAFTLETVGEVQVQRVFERFAENARSTTKLSKQIVKDLMLIERVQFLTEGRGGWAALMQDTIKAKRRKHQEPWILRATNALFKSLTEPGAEGQVLEALTGFIRFGTSLPYGGFHQKGTVNMPQRRLVQLTGAERVELTRAVQRFIVTGQVQSIHA